MKTKWLLIALALLLVVAAIVVALPDPVRDSVSVTFVGYTNRDSNGMNDMYTWAWFRIENRSQLNLGLEQGAIDVERAGAWVHLTNRSGFTYGGVAPGETRILSLVPPSEGTRWRNNFLINGGSLHSVNYWRRKQQFEVFMNNLRVRLGLRPRPWIYKPLEPIVLTTDTIDLKRGTKVQDDSVPIPVYGYTNR